jgi:hypothetical protein
VPSASVPWLQGRKGVWALKGTQSQSSRFASRVMVACGIHLHGRPRFYKAGLVSGILGRAIVNSPRAAAAAKGTATVARTGVGGAAPTEVFDLDAEEVVASGNLGLPVRHGRHDLRHKQPSQRLQGPVTAHRPFHSQTT